MSKEPLKEHNDTPQIQNAEDAVVTEGTVVGIPSSAPLPAPTMGKKEAADLLNVGVRAVERYVKIGKLTCDYENARHGRRAVFQRSEVMALKATLPTTKMGRPPKGSKKSKSRKKPSTRRIARMEPQQTPTQEKPVKRTEESRQSKPTIQEMLERLPFILAAKLLLNVSEAAIYAGLSEATIRAAVKTGAVPARKVEHEVMIRPGDLKAWIDGMFAEELVQKPTPAKKYQRAHFKASRAKPPK